VKRALVLTVIIMTVLLGCALGPKSFVLTFDANGGTGSMSPKEVVQGQSTTLTSNTFTMTSYVFVGWNTETDGSGTAYIDGASYTMGDADIILYAQWALTYTVTFDANMGSGTMNPQEIGEDQTVPLNSNTYTRTYYTFTGWNTEQYGTGTTYADGANYLMGSSDVTLYAQWEEVASWNVYFNSNGGSGSMTNQSLYVGYSEALDANTFTRDLYSFTGWNTASDGSGISYTDQEEFFIGDGDVTLYAQWEALPTWTITFDSNGGSGTMSAQDIIQGQKEALDSNTFTRSLYTFTGWNTASDGSGTSYADGADYTMGSADVTLYAQWALFHTITFDSNGGSGTMNAQDIIQDQIEVLDSNTFTRTLYNFTGWNTVSDGSGTSYADGADYTMGSEDVTLYAQWDAVQVQYNYTSDNEIDLTYVTDGWRNISIDFTDGTINLFADSANLGTALIVFVQDDGGSNYGYLRFSSSSNFIGQVSSNMVIAVDNGTTISPSDTWSTSTAEISGSFANWGDKSHVYIPFKIRLEANTMYFHYGYIEVSFVDNPGLLTIHSIAYMKAVDTSIVAGQSL